MQPTWYEDPRNKMRERSVGVIALIALSGFVVIAGTIFAYYFLPNPDLIMGTNEGDTRSRKLLQLTLEDAELVVSSQLVARVKKRTLGSVEQVDLELPWPFDATASLSPPEHLRDHSNQLILSFLPTPPGLSVQERFAGIYKPYIARSHSGAPAGLRHYVFSTDSPYANIEYFVGQIGNANVYFQCELRASSLGPRLCSNMFKSTRRTSLRYRFARRHLAQWREIDHAVKQLMLQVMRLRQPTEPSG